jgi:hypothetical protein
VARSLIRIFTLAAAIFCAALAHAATPPSSLPPLVATRTTTAHSIDGALDDEAWRGGPQPTGEWRSYNPLNGDTIPQQTHVWIAYDDRYLYFAFQCDDQEPDRIKASVARRDTIFSDDWVGLSLDALGTGQVSYHMMVNPVGVQMDMLNSASSFEDLAPDWTWDSAGKPTPNGYSVEIRLPLESIRFKGGDSVRMGVLFWRHISRSGVSVAWPAMNSGQWVFDVHSGLMFSHLESRLAREVIPSATYNHTRSREDTPVWSEVLGGPQAGLSARVGLTSTTSLDATVNPDFSQVESDAFQVEVNQRFPVFYSEKRPFFMQGSDVFKLGGVGNGDASMQAAVHTRQIVDPIAGAKVTGTVGRLTFGTLNASDEAPGKLAAEDGTAGAGRNRQFNIGRLQYGLGPSSFAGAIVTDTRFAGDDNQVVGADLALKVSETQRVSAMVLQSWSDRRGDKSQGVALQANYSHSTQRSTQSAQFEHYDPAFAMDTAFYTRVGFTSGWGYADYNIDPDKTKYPWVHRISPFTFLQRAYDRIQRGDELTSVTGVRIAFTRQGFFRIDGAFGQEPWAGHEYAVRRVRSFGSVQLFRWLQANGSFVNGSAIYYDPENPYAGRDHSLNVGVTLQPTGRFTEDLSYTHEVFHRADDGRLVYDLDIINSRTTYQFTRFVFVRGTAQYDSSRAQVLTDFLASYEMRPGSVLYAGYGSLVERRSDLAGAWTTGIGPYLTTRRGLFLKASYLYRF